MRRIARLIRTFWSRRELEFATRHLSNRMREDAGLPPREEHPTLWPGRPNG
jgi:hypothetical protein